MNGMESDSQSDSHDSVTQSLGTKQSDGRVEPLTDESQLRAWYSDQQLSTRDIARKVGVSNKTVQRWLHRHQIDTRPVNAHQSTGNTDPLRDESQLRAWYVDDEMSGPEIADQLDVTPSTVYRWLRKYDIPITGHSSHHSVPETDPHKNKSWLQTQYVDTELTGYEIAAQLGVSATTIYNWLDEHNIETRDVM